MNRPMKGQSAQSEYSCYTFRRYNMNIHLVHSFPMHEYPDMIWIAKRVLVCGMLVFQAEEGTLLSTRKS